MQIKVFGLQVQELVLEYGSQVLHYIPFVLPQPFSFSVHVISHVWIVIVQDVCMPETSYRTFQIFHDGVSECSHYIQAICTILHRGAT